MYFFNDADEPSFHAASGLTRNFEPKPSFHAVAHLYRSLGEYRFRRIVLQKEGEAYVYEFTHATEPKTVLVAWSPTGSGRSAEIDIPLHSGRVVRAEKMPLAAGEAARVETTIKGTAVHFTVDEGPAYLWIEPK